MRIIQMLPILSFGDAIGNDTLALGQTLKDNGYDTHIYAEYIDKRIQNSLVSLIENYICRPDDMIIYHLSTGSDMNYKFSEYDCTKIVLYHNITPPRFFEAYTKEMAKVCEDGLRASQYLGKCVDYALADSDFNKQELINMGYSCKTEVLPILIAFDDYKKKPTPRVVQKYKDGRTNIVFTGRVAPNKKFEDIIAAFCYYKRNIDPNARLILVGRHDGLGSYYDELRTYVQMLKVEDVIFTGQVSFNDILAYYTVADAFVCLSEHEGFCVPLVEAMMFDVPIIAYDSCAIAETLGGSGLLLREKSPAIVAEAIHCVVSNQELKRKILENQRMRLRDFDHEKIKTQFLGIIKRWMGNC